MTSSHKKTWR